MGNQALHLPAIERDGEAAKAVEGDRAFLVAGILTAKFAGSAGTPWWGRCAKPMAPISRQASAATCGSIPCAAARVPLSRKSSKESNPHGRLSHRLRDEASSQQPPRTYHPRRRS